MLGPVAVCDRALSIAVYQWSRRVCKRPPCCALARAQYYACQVNQYKSCKGRKEGKGGSSIRSRTAAICHRQVAGDGTADVM